MKENLEPCPFCGAPAKECSPDFEIEVHCTRCAAKVEAAPEFWNRRALSPPGFREGIEAAAKVAERMRDDPRYAEPTQFDYGAQDACFVIAKAILSLAPTGEDGWMPIETGETVTLAECPPGLFMFGGTLGFKTEYGGSTGKDIGGGKVEWTVSNWPDVYCVESGEIFWGGAKSQEERAALLVAPLTPPRAKEEG